jgi:hypothetical protein
MTVDKKGRLMNLIVLLLMFVGLLVPIILFNWWMKRLTGYQPGEYLTSGKSSPSELELLKRRYVIYDPEKHTQREKKDNPHFDALVDAEWKAIKHLEETSPEDAPESDEIRTLIELLEPKNKQL